jgi:hypothetical protein
MSNSTPVRDLRENYARFDNQILDRHGDDLGVYGLAVYMVLCRYASSDGEAFPSHRAAAEMIGCSPGKVKDALADLKLLGWVDVRPRYRSDGSQTSNVYVLLPPPEETTEAPPAGSDTPPGPGSDTPPGPGSDIPTMNKTQRNKTQSNKGHGSTGSLRSPSEPEALGASGESPAEFGGETSSPDSQADDEHTGEGNSAAGDDSDAENETPTFDSIGEERQHFAAALEEAVGGQAQAILREVCERLYGFTAGYKEIGGWKKRVAYAADDPARRALNLLYRYAHASIDGHPLHYISAAEARRRREGDAPSGSPALPARPEHGAVYTRPEVRFYTSASSNSGGGEIDEDHFHGAGTDPASGGDRVWRYLDPDEQLADLGLGEGMEVQTPRGNAAVVVGWTPEGVILRCEATGKTGTFSGQRLAPPASSGNAAKQAPR